MMRRRSRRTSFSICASNVSPSRSASRRKASRVRTETLMVVESGIPWSIPSSLVFAKTRVGRWVGSNRGAGENLFRVAAGCVRLLYVAYNPRSEYLSVFHGVACVASHQVTFATDKVTPGNERIELADRSATVSDLRQAGQPARRLRRRPRRLRTYPAGAAHDQRAAVEGLGSEAPHQRARHQPRSGIVSGGGAGHRTRAGAGQPPQDRSGHRPAYH